MYFRKTQQQKFQEWGRKLKQEGITPSLWDAWKAAALEANPEALDCKYCEGTEEYYPTNDPRDVIPCPYCNATGVNDEVPSL